LIFIILLTSLELKEKEKVIIKTFYYKATKYTLTKKINKEKAKNNKVSKYLKQFYCISRILICITT